MRLLSKLFFFSVLILGFTYIPHVEAAGTFSLSPASGNLIRGCTQAVNISESVTSSESNAADVIISYDTTKIEIIDALPNVPGVQILPGNAYESYAGNTVNTSTGEIRLVGYSSSSTLATTATFGTIYFKSKTLATNGSFAFNFTGASPYNTLDSNIADATTSYDMLTGVTNANYTFISGNCNTDTTPPTITFVSPTNLQNNVAPDSSVTIKLSDNQSGILLSTLQITINGTLYSATSPEVAVSGSPSSYTVTVMPSSPFPTNSVSVVSVTISDTAGNTRNGNISINSGYACPVTYVTKPGLCPSPTTATNPDRVSPTVTVSSDTVIDIKKDFRIIIKLHDNKGISPNSFALTIGKTTFTPTATPDRLTITGSKNDYTVEILLHPDEMQSNDEGKLLAVVRVSDLEGNTRIENLLFATNAPRSPGSTKESPKTIIQKVATAIATAVAPILAVGYVLFFVVLGTQPTIATVLDEKKQVVRFPRGFIKYSNGKVYRLYGGIDGKLHGRIPHEPTILLVQKYGYTPTSIPLHPSVKHEVKRVTLQRI